MSSFNYGDLVWAKMKGYPEWPGSISRHPEGVLKKAHHYVFFYSSQNYAWISDKEIHPHSKELVDKFDAKLKFSKRFVGLQQAVDQICRESEQLAAEARESETEVISRDLERWESKPGPASKKPKIVKKSTSKLSYSPKVVASKETEKPKKDVYELSDSEDSMEWVADSPPTGFRKKKKEASSSDEDSESGVEDILQSKYSTESSVTSKPKAMQRKKPKRSVKAIQHQESSDEQQATEGDLESDAQDFKFDEEPVRYRKTNRKNSSPKKTPKKRLPRLGVLGTDGIAVELLRSVVPELRKLSVWCEEKMARYVLTEAVDGEINFVAKPKDLLGCSDIVLCFVADSDRVKQMVLQSDFWSEAKAQPKMAKGFVLCGNHTPKDIQLITDLVTVPGLRFLSVCIAAKLDASNIKDASLMASGDIALFSHTAEIFKRLSVQLDFFEDRPERSATVNIGVSMIECMNLANLTQVAKMVEFQGVNVCDLLASLENSQFCGSSIVERLETMTLGDSTTAAPFTTSDISSGVNLFQESGISSFMASTVCDMYKASKSSGNDDMDLCVLMNSFEKQRADSNNA